MKHMYAVRFFVPGTGYCFVNRIDGEIHFGAETASETLAHLTGLARYQVAKRIRKTWPAATIDVRILHSDTPFEAIFAEAA